MSDYPTITIDSVSVTRGGKKVLQDLRFDITPGSVTGLLGPSGSGKTTLLRALVGVQRNVEGDIRVLGHAAGEPTLRHRVAYVTQAPSVYEDLTIAENMTYFATIVGAEDRHICRVLDNVVLTAQADQAVKTLSGGQR